MKGEKVVRVVRGVFALLFQPDGIGSINPWKHKINFAVCASHQKTFLKNSKTSKPLTNAATTPFASSPKIPSSSI